jgi:hypothetical protein
LTTTGWIIVAALALSIVYRLARTVGDRHERQTRAQEEIAQSLREKE